MRCNGAILWSAKTLKVVTDSTAHAETAEASRATKATVFLRMVLDGIGRPVEGPTAILGDKSAMVELVSKEGASIAVLGTSSVQSTKEGASIAVLGTSSVQPC